MNAFIVSMFDRSIEGASPMELQEIAGQLERFDGAFPLEAVEAAIANPEAVTPQLLRMLEYTVQNMEVVANDESYMGHLYAMFLLAQFREPQAYPYFIQIMSAPSDIVGGTLGDTLTDSGDQLLASVYDGDIEPLKRLVENAEADEFARAVALDAMRILVVKGVETREEIIDYLETLYRGKLEREESFVWHAVIDNTIKLYGERLFDDVRQVFADGLIDPFLEKIEFAEQEIARGEEATLKQLYADDHHRYVTDTIAEMDWWAMFHPEKDTPPTPPEKPYFEPYFNPTTVVRTEPKIGRNDPCPCGSELKYKKCHVKRSHA